MVDRIDNDWDVQVMLEPAEKTDEQEKREAVERVVNAVLAYMELTRPNPPTIIISKKPVEVLAPPVPPAPPIAAPMPVLVPDPMPDPIAVEGQVEVLAPPAPPVPPIAAPMPVLVPDPMPDPIAVERQVEVLAPPAPPVPPIAASIEVEKEEVVEIIPATGPSREEIQKMIESYEAQIQLLNQQIAQERQKLKTKKQMEVLQQVKFAPADKTKIESSIAKMEAGIRAAEADIASLKGS